MHLRRSVHNVLFWACDSYVACGTSHGAHADGTPLGIPADAETKAWRVKAHHAFDSLWRLGEFSRNEAYAWLCQRMNMTRDEGHIGRFTIEECQLLIAYVEEHQKEQS